MLVPTREHARALESVQLKAARMILRCPPRTSSDVTRADMGLQLLSSRRDIAKLKWQHSYRLHGLPADRLERVYMIEDCAPQHRPQVDIGAPGGRS